MSFLSSSCLFLLSTAISTTSQKLIRKHESTILLLTRVLESDSLTSLSSTSSTPCPCLSLHRGSFAVTNAVSLALGLDCVSVVSSAPRIEIMADFIITPLVDKLSSIIEEKANAQLSSTIEETKLFSGVEEQMASLHGQLGWIRGFLLEAEKKGKEFEVVKVWVRQVRDLAYEAEDVIDTFDIHVELPKNGIAKRVMRFWRKLKTQHRVGKLIEHINKRSAEISTYRSRFNIDISAPAEDLSTETLQTRRRTTFIIEEPVIVGFHEEASELANWLIEQEEEPRRRVMSIIGMGGLGKTTLAKLIYGRKDVEDHFDLRAWTCVSQEYETKDLLLSTLKQVKGVIPDYELSRLEGMNEGELQTELHEYLNGKRYLVVIDDMWQAEAWKGICKGFPENHNSSRVVITTRNMEVATGADPLSEHHKLRLLKEEESWELLCKKVFAKGSCPPELVGVGKEIVEKCRGLPLAIVVLGGLLIRKRKTRDAWSKVLASANWQLAQDSNPCYEIIALSYADLPYYLKSCFLYLGLYPEDFEINVKKLTLLWIAEGFVQSRGDVEVEDVAEDYFVELTQRSLIQVAERRYEGGPVETCRVHDLLRDLAISKARDYKFMDYYGRNNDVSNSRSRRISIHSGITRADGVDFSHFTPNLRTLLFFGRRTDMNMWFQDGIKMLRVLDLKSVDLWCHMPEDIGKLIFLQYLGFDTKTNTFPTSICDLPKLQVLDFRGAYISPCLPSKIWKMKQLRHLYFEMYCWYGVEDFDSVDTETLPSNLLTLEISSDIWAKLGEKGLSKAFVEFNRIRSLTLRGELKVESLQYCFPSSLTVLNLEGCLLETDPSDVLGNLTNLEELRICIASYMGKRMSFTDKGFPQLKFLQLQELPLEEWVVQDGAMPQLKHLMIGDCQSLRMLPDGLRYVTGLQKLELSLMPKEFRNRLKENGQDWNKIQNVPFIVGI